MVHRPEQTAKTDLVPGSAARLRVAIVRSRYHDAITTAMLDGAVETLTEAGGDAESLLITEAPGSFDLIAVCSGLARRADIDGIVALGCIITGETRHDQFIAQAVSNGLAALIVQHDVPIAFGVLTCRSLDQARERAGGDKGNKGAEAMAALIATIHSRREADFQSACEKPGARR